MSLSEIIQHIIDGAAKTSLLEWAAFVAAMLYVVLAAFENILCWLFGIISSLIFVYLCLDANLLLETGLQAFYVFMGAYGWWQWIRNKSNAGQAPVITWTFAKHLPFLAAGAAAGTILGYVFSSYTTASLPYLDAWVTCFSLIATWMVTKKILENWIYWIAIDAASVYLYGNRELYLSSFLFVIYTIIAAAGYIQWKKELKASHA